jgi:hypothetical protein
MGIFRRKPSPATGDAGAGGSKKRRLIKRILMWSAPLVIDRILRRRGGGLGRRK